MKDRLTHLSEPIQSIGAGALLLVAMGLAACDSSPQPQTSPSQLPGTSSLYTTPTPFPGARGAATPTEIPVNPNTCQLKASASAWGENLNARESRPGQVHTITLSNGTHVTIYNHVDDRVDISDKGVIEAYDVLNTINPHIAFTDGMRAPQGYQQREVPEGTETVITSNFSKVLQCGGSSTGVITLVPEDGAHPVTQISTAIMSQATDPVYFWYNANKALITELQQQRNQPTMNHDPEAIKYAEERHNAIGYLLMELYSMRGADLPDEAAYENYKADVSDRAALITFDSFSQARAAVLKGITQPPLKLLVH